MRFAVCVLRESRTIRILVFGVVGLREWGIECSARLLLMIFRIDFGSRRFGRECSEVF